MILIVVISLLSVFDTVNTKTVKTKYGVVKGGHITLHDRRKVNTFLGIPYAKPPVGALRWKPPEEPERWTKPFEAKKYGPSCPQVENPRSIVVQTHPKLPAMDEDCLTLNIYSPRNSKTRRPYPVIVFLHGGTHQRSGSIQYNGHFLAAEDVVVVVPNFRIGILGYGTTNDDEMKGNFGLLDQIQVLKFVKENIDSFNGDPKSVTLMGQSSGGTNVGLHMLSPLSKGLFHRAICLSGNEFMAFAYIPPQLHPEALTFDVGKQLGCNQQKTKELVACLRGKSAMDLVKIVPKKPFVVAGFSPVVDKHFLVDAPISLRLAGKAARVPLISGSMNDEGGEFADDFFPEAAFGGFNRTEYSKHIRLIAAIKTFGQSLDAKTSAAVSEAIQFMYTKWPHIHDKDRNRQSIINALSDTLFNLAMDLQVKLHSKFESQTYMYIFDYRSSKNTRDDILPRWMGNTHTMDLPYIFGWPLIKLNPKVREQTGIVDFVDWTKRDQEMSYKVIKMWTDFAKTGDPTPESKDGDCVKWPKFDNTDLKYLEIEPTNKVKSHYRQRYMALYTNYIPWIISQK